MRSIFILAFAILMPCFAAQENIAANTAVTVSSVHPGTDGKNLTDGKKWDGKNSRWVSAAFDTAPWFVIDLGKEMTFNCVTFAFYKGYPSTDFDIDVWAENSWKTIRNVRGNASEECQIFLPNITASKLRFRQLRGASDSMARVYECEITKERLHISTMLNAEDGIIDATKAPQVTISNVTDTPAAITVNAEITPLTDVGSASREPAKTIDIANAIVYKLPLPKHYGIYRYTITLSTADGYTKTMKTGVYYTPTNAWKSPVSSPFGLHWKGVSAASYRKLGIPWLRSHDMRLYYWNGIEDDDGKQDWSIFKNAIQESIQSDIPNVLVVEGAPKRYSTAYDADTNSWGILGYYPPSDLGAWFTNYVYPLVDIAKSLPHRTYEIWNETWSYYRWRGLYGTPAELMHFNRINYEEIKRRDPSSLVFITDTRLGRTDSDLFSYAKLADDMLDLGLLRFTDIATYHAYGMASQKFVETIKQRLWNFGRDMQLWDTETGRYLTPVKITRSMADHRRFGADKIFIYNQDSDDIAERFARFYTPDEDKRPTEELVAFSAMARNLDDGLFLGCMERDGALLYLFANKGSAVVCAIASDKGDASITIPPDTKRGAYQLDIFGNRTVHTGSATVPAQRPLYIVNPAPEFILECISSELNTRASLGNKTITASDIPVFSAASSAAYAGELETFRLKLAAGRTNASMDGNALYDANFMLDILDGYRVLRARQDKAHRTNVNADLYPVAELIEKGITAKTKQNGALLNAERMLSRARKYLQFATALAAEGDEPGRQVMLSTAQYHLQAARSYLAKESPSPIYSAKMYFRSLKSELRSDVYDFIPGKAQPAVVSIANPFSKRMKGVITIAIPDGVTADKTTFTYDTAPFSRDNFTCSVSAGISMKKGSTFEIRVTDTTGILAHIARCRIVDTMPPAPVLLQKKATDAVTPGN
ncbi:MAG: discoidin domain-containing protein [Spirochaetes bacterium]|nr:discoidin domain-containing protein [Spirochaetota bacterium]